MAQDYKVIPAQQSLKDSLPNLNSNFAAVASDFSGSAFPTNNLLEGMTCYRTDIKKVYRYVSTGKDTFDWKLVEDLNVDYGDALFAETAGKAEALNANIADTRTVATNPNDYNGVMKCVGIKRADAIALTSIDGISGATTAYVCGIRGFGDNSGGAAHETAYCSNGSVYHRTGDATSWGAWSRIVRTSDTIAANSAIKDGSGNIIVDTYLTKTGTAANSTKLNGSAASEYLKTNGSTATTLTVTGTLNIPGGSIWIA